MAETEMIERVATAILAESQNMGGLAHRLSGEQSIENRLARAAIEAIFKGSRFTEFHGMTVIANPDFQAHYWDGEQMLPVQVAALSSDTSRK